MHDSSDLDKVARSLASPDASDDSALTARLDRWLAGLVSRRGSDLLLVQGAPPCIRVDGEVRKISSSPLDGPEIEAAVLEAVRQKKTTQDIGGTLGTREAGEWVAKRVAS